MKIAVIGAESFVGRVLVSLLREKGAAIAGIDMAKPSMPESVMADIRGPELAAHIPENANAVVHLAAVSREPDCAADPRLAFDVNVTGTANVIAAARARGARQVVFASSEWVYGDVANTAVQDEDTLIDIAKVRNEYAASKLAGEMALNVAVRRGLAAGTVLRFGIIYGPRPANWSAVEALVNTARTKDEVTVGSLATARRFIHVRDICAGILASVGRTGFEIFNLAGDELVSLERVIELAAAAAGRHPKIAERDPAAVSIRNPVSAKAEKQLGWKPAISISAGIRELNAYLERQKDVGA